MLKFSTKSKTLYELRSVVTKSKVLPQLSYKISDLYNNEKNIQTEIQKTLGFPTIVRSSAITEDTIFQSNAGKFLSIPNVKKENIINSIYRVFESYGNNDKDNEVFIQPMLQKIKMSGVIFTIDPNTMGNYFVINYDESGSFNSITSGLSNKINTSYIFHGFKTTNILLNKLVKASYELIDIFHNNCLDIEFAVDTNDDIFILQVRPLITTDKKVCLKTQSKYLNNIEKYLEYNFKKFENVHGDCTVYGIMPDWNPAEIIGTRPKPLALSLYKELITDNIWAKYRKNYGYRKISDNSKLMIDFYGLPYIDTRLSFNSLIPNKLDNNLANKLVNYYIEKLKNCPSKHDKIEFDIVLSTFTFNMDEHINSLKSSGFSHNEIEELVKHLKEITTNLIKGKEWEKGLNVINILERKQNNYNHKDDILESINILIEDCKEYGTKPFAGLARLGFIGIQLLNSLKETETISSEEYDSFIKSINTISKEMINDKTLMSTNQFIEKYGHLRPGTYDICSERYDKNPDRYFNVNSNISNENLDFSFSKETKERITARIINEKLNITCEELISFIKESIRAREYSKFIFSKNVSAILELLNKLGKRYNLKRDDMSYIDIQIFKNFYKKEKLFNSIKEGKKLFEITKSLSLPVLIQDAQDIYYFHTLESEPNYITSKKVVGEVYKDNLEIDSIKGKIIMIPYADPGYDWIFSQKIKGFITAYGGINSHMSIRARELGIPAIIGIGEKTYNSIKNKEIIYIDCLNKKVDKE